MAVYKSLSFRKRIALYVGSFVALLLAWIYAIGDFPVWWLFVGYAALPLFASSVVSIRHSRTLRWLYRIGLVLTVALVVSWIASQFFWLRAPIGHEQAWSMVAGNFRVERGVESPGTPLGFKAKWIWNGIHLGQFGEYYAHWTGRLYRQSTNWALWPLVVSMCVASLSLWRLMPLPRPVGHCVACGYDLTGNVTGRCSECGVDIGSQAQQFGNATLPRDP